MKRKLIVVVGATGKQGQSIIKVLIEKGYNVRALVREPNKCKSLFNKDDVELYRGDLRKKESIMTLFDDAYGLFFALPMSKESVSYGMTLLGLARDSNLDHIIYSSVGGVDRNLKVDHFLYKKQIEDKLRSIGKPFTILRPVGYMDTFSNSKQTKFITGLLSLYITESKKFQLISLQDIGKFAEIAFANPDKYIDKEVEIAGDELTLNELFEKIEKEKSIKLAPMRISKLVKFILPKSAKQMFEFYAEDGWCADLESLKKENPELLSFDEWLKVTETYE